MPPPERPSQVEQRGNELALELLDTPLTQQEAGSGKTPIFQIDGWLGHGQGGASN